jgi:hydrogenase maturation factor
MTGKIDPAQFERWIAPRLGAARPEVLYGPRPGGDAAIVRAGAGRVLAVTSDPLSLVPALGPERSAWLACHLVASDLWTTGIPPAYAAVTLNLPPGLDDATLERYLDAMHAAWRELEVAVVTGHTGRYEGCDLTIVGAATLMGLGDEGRWIGAPFVLPEDRVLITKDAALEATAIVAHLTPGRFGAALASLPDAPDAAEGLARARARLGQVSVVADCRAALRVGVRDRGVSAMHDATEGGVLGGLVELAHAVRLDLRIERAKIRVSVEARAACAAFAIDPYWTTSEGTLILCVRPAHAVAVVAALAAAGIPACDAGEVVRGTGTLWLTEPDGAVATLTQAEPDPWWPAYARAVREGWS